MAVRIGVTASTGDSPEEYLAALRAAGAEPVVFPNDVARVDDLLASVDGVLITGGADVDPQRYGARLHPQAELAGVDRDDFEIALVCEARERNVPLLAICRGLQVANVAFDGTLEQHVPDRPVAQRHRVLRDDGKTVRGIIADHVVDIEPESLLARVLGTKNAATNSRHHQAVDRVGAGLRVTGRTADGVIESLEATFPARFWLAVQWHPESTLDDGGTSRRLFDAFVAAACLAPLER